MDVLPINGSGTLPASGTEAISVFQGAPPFLLQLTSTAADRAISVSGDGVTFFPITPSASTTAAILCEWAYPAAQFLFSGAQGDKFNLL
jgi:hypothetical protein